MLYQDDKSALPMQSYMHTLCRIALPSHVHFNKKKGEKTKTTEYM